MRSYLYAEWERLLYSIIAFFMEMCDVCVIIAAGGGAAAVAFVPRAVMYAARNTGISTAVAMHINSSHRHSPKCSDTVCAN